MPTMIQRRENTATPAERQAATDALADQGLNDRCDELLARLGYQQPAAQ